MKASKIKLGLFILITLTAINSLVIKASGVWKIDRVKDAAN